jgi:hypothetical protein
MRLLSSSRYFCVISLIAIFSLVSLYFQNRILALHSFLFSAGTIDQSHFIHKTDKTSACQDRAREAASRSAWAKSQNLPNYIMEYFQWHIEMMCILEQQGQQQTMGTAAAASSVTPKFLVLQCTRVCGGLSDRLSPLPSYVLNAYRMKRILLIHWTKPCSLEEFLVPQLHGINWTVPTWLLPSIPKGISLDGMKNLMANTTSPSTVLTTKVQIAFAPGKAEYNNQILREFNDTLFIYERIYHDLFHSIFALVPPIQSMVQQRLNNMSLTPGNFTAVHVRTRHPGTRLGNATWDKSGGLLFSGKTKERLVSIVTNAINCALTLHPGLPIYVASDSQHLVNFLASKIDLVANAATDTTSIPRIIGWVQEDEPLHLDGPIDRHPSDFYQTFADLMLLSMSCCTAYGVGGYGRLALSLSYNTSCYINYDKTPCPLIYRVMERIGN